jgi:hypothetical protein
MDACIIERIKIVLEAISHRAVFVAPVFWDWVVELVGTILVLAKVHEGSEDNPQRRCRKEGYSQAIKLEPDNVVEQGNAWNVSVELEETKYSKHAQIFIVLIDN